MIRVLTVLGVFLLPAVAAAHPDHATAGDHGLLHFVTDPFHVGISAACVLVFVAARRALLRHRTASRRSR